MLKFSRLTVFSYCLVCIFSIGTVAAQDTPIDPWQGVAPQVVSDEDFQNVIGVLGALAKHRVKVNMPHQSTAADQVAELAANPNVMKTLGDAGYTAETFHPLLINAMIALRIAGSSMSIQGIENARKTLETQEKSMPTEQFEAAMRMVDVQQELLHLVPPENIALASKYHSEFSVLWESEK